MFFGRRTTLKWRRLPLSADELTNITSCLFRHGIRILVRSDEYGENTLATYLESSKGQLAHAVVPDIAQDGASDEAIILVPPFDAVLHTASPFHFQFQDPKKLLDPAIHRTKGILRAIKDKAPSVKRVVITSSFAAIVSTDGHPDVSI